MWMGCSDVMYRHNEMQVIILCCISSVLLCGAVSFIGTYADFFGLLFLGIDRQMINALDAVLK